MSRFVDKGEQVNVSHKNFSPDAVCCEVVMLLMVVTFTVTLSRVDIGEAITACRDATSPGSTKLGEVVPSLMISCCVIDKGIVVSSRIRLQLPPT